MLLRDQARIGVDEVDEDVVAPPVTSHNRKHATFVTLYHIKEVQVWSDTSILMRHNPVRPENCPPRHHGDTKQSWSGGETRDNQDRRGRETAHDDLDSGDLHHVRLANVGNLV